MKTLEAKPFDKNAENWKWENRLFPREKQVAKLAKTWTWPYHASVFWYGGKILQSNAAAKMCTNREFGHPTHGILHTFYMFPTTLPSNQTVGEGDFIE